MTDIPVKTSNVSLTNILEKITLKLTSSEIKKLSSMPCVYVLYNINTKNYYIGSTKNFKLRIRDHYYDLIGGIHRNYKVAQDYKNNGDNYYFDVLEYCSKEERFDKEQMWLNNFFSDEKCLNLSKIAFYNKELIQEERDKIRLKKQIPIICLNLNAEFIKEYNSVTEAANAVGSSTPNIALCCKHRSRSAKGYRFVYKKDYVEFNDYSLTKTTVNMTNLINKLSKPVLQYSLEGEFIQEWKSASEASRHFKVHDSTIGGCCNGKQKTSVGFIWKFK